MYWSPDVMVMTTMTLSVFVVPISVTVSPMTGYIPAIVFCYAIRADDRDVHQLDHPESLPAIENGGNRWICCYRITLDSNTY